MRFFTLLFALVTLNLSPAFASPPEAPVTISAAQLFQKGLEAYQQKNYKDAREHFSQAYQAEPQNPQVLYNWGLSEYQLGHLGMAVAAWRRSLYLEPGFRAVEEALEFVKSQLQRQRFATDDQGWEAFRSWFLVPVSLDKYLGLSALLLLVCGWLLIRYAGSRQKALNEETPLPPFPTVATILTLFFILSVTLACLKLVDHFQPRATVIKKLTSVQSAPETESSTLFELPEGSEVIIHQFRKGWTQITYPGGMTGWVQTDSLFQTSGRSW